MPTIYYILCFQLREPTRYGTCEIQEHLSLADAWNAFRLFAEPDSAELYASIELIERGWMADTECVLAKLEFPT